MKGDKTLSVFVDESGRFKYPDSESHYYIVGLVFHDQDFDIAPLVRQMDRNADELGLDAEVFTFHAGPIIRQEKGYELMNRHFRGRIFNRMMNFARRVDFRYHCIDVDKRFVTSTLQIATKLKRGLEDFLKQKRDEFADVTRVKIYYDCGQAAGRLCRAPIPDCCQRRNSFFVVFPTDNGSEIVHNVRRREELRCGPCGRPEESSERRNETRKRGVL